MANPLWKHKYGTKRWKILANDVKERDNYTCQKCNRFITQGQWSVHHIIKVTKDNYNDDNIFYNSDNLILLCEKCHKAVHSDQADYTNNRFNSIEESESYVDDEDKVDTEKRLKDFYSYE